MNLPTIRENYMQNAAETRKLYAKYNGPNYTQKIQILSQCKRHIFYNNTHNTNFITMQKTQISQQYTKHKFHHYAKDTTFITIHKTQILSQMQKTQIL